LPVTAFGTAMLDAQNGGSDEVKINGHVAQGYCSRKIGSRQLIPPPSAARRRDRRPERLE
jgi:hypothetical protein